MNIYQRETLYRRKYQKDFSSGGSSSGPTDSKSSDNVFFSPHLITEGVRDLFNL